MSGVLEPVGRRAEGLPHRVVAAVVARPAVALAAIVSASSAIRVVAGWQHSLPRYFPDEYIYTALARSIADGQLAIRGTPARFPALLEPILTAPFALTGDPEIAYRMTQTLHAVAMSAAAIPVYLIARRVALPVAHALVAAALAIALPSLVFAAYVTADAIAYPLVLGAIAAGIGALERPTARAQLAFLSLAGAATFARMQYVVLFAAFLAATAIVGGTGGRRFVSAFRVTWGLAVAGAAVGVALGPGSLLGYYDGVLDLSLPVVSIGRWIAVDAMLLAFAAGIVLVPGAVVGLLAGLRRSALRGHRSFSALVTVFAVLVLLEAGLYAANGSGRFQERYLLTLPALVPIAFSLSLRLLPGAGRVTALASLGLIVVAARSPLTDYTLLAGAQDSPFLQGVARFARRLDDGSGALALSAAATMLCLAAVATALRPRIAPAALALAACAIVPMAVLATRADIETSSRMAATYTLDGDPSWVDAAGGPRASVVVSRGAERGNVSSILFWNRSVTEVLALPRAPGVDTFGTVPTRISSRGALIAGGRAVGNAVVVEESFTQMLLDDADLLRRTPTASLWRPHGNAHVAAALTGRYVDGWLDRVASLTVWPRPDGPRLATARFVLSLPSYAPPQTIVVGTGRSEVRVPLVPGRQVAVAIPVIARNGPVRLPIRSTSVFALDGRLVTAQATRPTLRTGVELPVVGHPTSWTPQ